MTTVTRRQEWHRRAYAALAMVALWPALAMAQYDETWSPLERAPEDIERLLLGLKTADSGLPLAARRGMLQRAEILVVPNEDGPPDRYLRLKHEADGLYFSATVRTLAAVRPQDTVYLLQTGSEIDGCVGLKALLVPGERVGSRFCVFDEEQGAARIQAGAAPRFGFTAYRLDGERVHDVTRRVLPDDPLLRASDRASYAVHDETGAHPGVSVDMSRLPEVTVLRLYVELGDGGGLPRDHPRAFSAGYPGDVHIAHFGFLVWNGQRFDLRNTVPRELWPCTHDARFSPSGQSCLDRDPDPFIAPTTPAL